MTDIVVGTTPKMVVLTRWLTQKNSSMSWCLDSWQEPFSPSDSLRVSGIQLFYNLLQHLVGGWATPLKNMSSSIGMIRNPIYGKIKNGNQTTNQTNIGHFCCIKNQPAMKPASLNQLDNGWRKWTDLPEKRSPSYVTMKNSPTPQ